MSKFYNIDTSTNLGGVNASDIKVSLQKSIKTYIDESLPTLTSQLTNDSGFITSEEALPSVTESDNGKVLMVVDGSWSPSMVQTNVYFTGNTAPDNSLGNDGDLYLETL